MELELSNSFDTEYTHDYRIVYRTFGDPVAVRKIANRPIGNTWEDYEALALLLTDESQAAVTILSVTAMVPA